MMGKIRALLRKPKWRTFLFISFVLLFYYTRTRPPDLILDMKILPGRAVLAMGETGVALLDLTNPLSPAEITVYDTSGKASGIDVSDGLIFVADGSAGVKILSLENLGETGTLERIASVSTPKPALDVAVQGKLVFVAAHDAGVMVFRLVEKDDTLSLSPLPDTPVDVGGRAEHIAIASPYLYVSTDEKMLIALDASDPAKLARAGDVGLDEPIRNFVVDPHTGRVYVAAGKGGLVVLDVSGLPGVITTLAQFTEEPDVSAVALRGPYAYVANGRAGYAVLDVSDVTAISVLGTNTSPSDANQIGILDEYIYVADGRVGLRAFESPVTFGFQLRNTTEKTGAFKNVLVYNDWAYVAAGNGGLQVIDVSDPAAPVRQPYVDETGDYATSLAFYNGHLYVTYSTQGLMDYDITTSPDHPVPTGVQTAIPGQATDVKVDGAFAYVTAGDTGFHVVDFSNIAAPQVFSVDTLGQAQGVFVLDKYAYVADGSAGIQIFSIQDPRNPHLVNAIDTDGEARAVFVQWQPAQNGEQRLYAFVADGPNGLYIVDVTDPASPVSVVTYPTDSFVNDVIVNGSTVYLGERDEGVLVLDVSRIGEPNLLGKQDTPGQVNGLFVGGDKIVYVADDSRGLRLINAATPPDFWEIGALDSPKTFGEMVTQGNYGYLLDGGDGLWILDLTNPDAPVPRSFYPTPGQARDLVIQGGWAYIADGDAGLQIVDVSNASAPAFIGEYREIQGAQTVAVQGEIAYVGTSDGHLYILDVFDPTNIREESVYNTIAPPLDLDVWHGYVYLVEGGQGLEIVNVENLRLPVQVASEYNLGLQDARSISVVGEWRRIFIADGVGGLKVLDISNPASPWLVLPYTFDGGIATDLTVYANYIFVSVENWGVAAFDSYNVDKLLPVGEYRPPELEDGTTPFRAHAIAVANTTNEASHQMVVYVPAGDAGMQIFRVNGRIEVQQSGLYETPGEAGFMDVMRNLPAMIVGMLTLHPEDVPAKVWLRLNYMAFGTFLFFVLSVFWLLLLAQFILPTQTFQEGYQAFRRLLASLWGSHGPVVFVRDGKVIARPGELERRGRGVARVDLNSAIILGRRALWRFGRQSRRENAPPAGTDDDARGTPARGPLIPRAHVEGPGIVFFRARERIHGAVDLRPQFRIRPGVRANTREGIEVETPVWVLFTLGQPPDVLDVAYDGERTPENLRVIKLERKYAEQRQRSVLAVTSVSDELDLADKKEIHRYVQRQEVGHYFETVKRLAIRLVDDQRPEARAMRAYSRRVSGLANRWGIADHERVGRFTTRVRELMRQCIDDETPLRWFVYQVSILADQLADPRMETFYRYLRPRMARRYKICLEFLAEQSAFDAFRERMQTVAAQDIGDENGVLDVESLNRLGLDALALLDDVRQTTEDILAGIGEDSETNEPELRLEALEQLRAITENLLRTDLPSPNDYRALAELAQNFDDMQAILQSVDLRDDLRFPGYWRLRSLRNMIRRIRNDVFRLTEECEAPFDSYLNRIEIDSYIRQLQTCLTAFQRVPAREKLRECVIRVRRQTDLLEQITSSTFRRPSRDIRRWAEDLDTNDDAQMLFFAQRVVHLTKKIAEDDQNNLSGYMTRTRERVRRIQAQARRFAAQSRTIEGDAEINEYRQAVDALHPLLDRCRFPDRLLKPSRSDSQRKQVGPFHLDEQRVLAAIYSQALDRNRGDDGEHMPWTELPVHVAVQIFRDIVSREQYDHLYMLGDPNRYNLPMLKNNLRVRMRNQGVLAFRFVDQVDGKTLEKGSEWDDDELVYYPEQELRTPKVLRARGVKVIAAGIPDLFPVSARVPARLLDLWSAPWESQATDIRSAYQLQAERIINQARAEAQREMAFTLARILQSSRSDEALAMRVFQALEAIADNTDTREFLPRDTTALLRSFRRWFLEDESDEDLDRPLDQDSRGFMDDDTIPED